MKKGGLMKEVPPALLWYLHTGVCMYYGKMSFEMRGFKATQLHIPTVEMKLNWNSESTVLLFVFTVQLCGRKLLEQRGDLVNKGWINKWTRRELYGPSDSHRRPVKDGVSKCKYSIFTVCWCYYSTVLGPGWTVIKPQHIFKLIWVHKSCFGFCVHTHIRSRLRLFESTLSRKSIFFTFCNVTKTNFNML